MFKPLLKRIRNYLIVQLTTKEAWISHLKTAALMAVVIISITYYQQRNMPSGEAPTPLIDFSQGPTLVYFWGSWCPICKTTSPSVSTLAEEGNYQVISVALSSGSDEEIKAYQEDKDYYFKTINDDSGQISQQWGVAVTPSIFYINTESEITAISTGMTSLWGMRFRLWLSQ